MISTAGEPARDYSAKLRQLFLDGIIGRDFSKGLAFYLDRYREYLLVLKQIALRDQAAPTAATIKS